MLVFAGQVILLVAAIRLQDKMLGLRIQFFAVIQIKAFQEIKLNAFYF